MRRFPDPLIAFASGWMQIRQRMKQRGVELPLVISDHCDWDELTQTIRDTGASQVWVTHGREEALVRWCELNQLARPPAASRRLRGRGGVMRAFADLLERLVLTPSRNGKIELLVHYFRDRPDPDRGIGLAAITGALDLPAVKPGLIRQLAAEVTDPELFRLFL